MDLASQSKEQWEKEKTLRSIVKKIQDENEIIERIANQLVAQYSYELDVFVEELNRLIKRIELGDVEGISDLYLEFQCIKLPVIIYQVNDEVEKLAGQTEVARAYKDEVFRKYFEKATGTIPDKTHASNLKCTNEIWVTKIMEIAYRRLKGKVKKAEIILDGLKKVLTSRIVNKEVFRKEHNRYGVIDRELDLGIEEDTNGSGRDQRSTEDEISGETNNEAD